LIELNQVNFEERRVAVLSAIDQVVLNDQIQKLREERGQEAGVTAARDVVSALADLQTAQNDFLSVWLNYEAQRLNLDRDLGTMNLDPEGNWIDPGPIGAEFGLPHPQDLPETSEFILEPSLSPHLLPAVEDQETRPLPPIEADPNDRPIEFIPTSVWAVPGRTTAAGDGSELLIRLPPLTDEARVTASRGHP
jgi:hypothetical protein